MKYGLLALMLAGVIAALSIDKGVLVTPQSEATPLTAEASTSEIFTLHARGSGESCTVRKSPGDGLIATVSVEPGCDALLPGLSHARYWQEGDDGSIVFSAESHEAIVSFTMADGVAYESFEPRSPLISLIAEN